MIIPQVVIAFELSDQAVLERLSKVRFDPVTGQVYAQAEDADSTIVRRLQERSENTLPQIEKRLNEYRDFLAAAETEFNRYLIRINAEESESSIFLNFCDAIENSV
jgi:adenylate kinase family enzyme